MISRDYKEIFIDTKSTKNMRERELEREKKIIERG